MAHEAGLQDIVAALRQAARDEFLATKGSADVFSQLAQALRISDVDVT
jgi:hypothetical protein